MFYAVYNQLGHGFLEKVYENALMIEFKRRGISAVQQRHVDVWYGGFKVGDYFADIVVEDVIVLELKAGQGIAPEHEAQLLNYLKATDIELGFVLNFGPKPQFIRRILSKAKRNSHE